MPLKKVFIISRSLPPSLNIPKGQLMGLLGPSGCGKTTLIKMIMGMLKPDNGAIEVLDLVVPHQQLLKDIGYMAQSDALYTDLTGRKIYISSLSSIPYPEQNEWSV